MTKQITEQQAIEERQKYVVSFSQRDHDDRLTHIYYTSPHELVKVNTVYSEAETLKFIFVGFGKRTLDAMGGKRLRFGIGFIRPVKNMRYQVKIKRPGVFYS